MDNEQCFDGGEFYNTVLEPLCEKFSGKDDDAQLAIWKIIYALG